MSKKRMANFADPLYWTTAAWNWSATDFWLDQLMTMAQSRFRWEGLPENVDTRFLEWVLLGQGVATIAWPDGFNPDTAIAMMAQTNGRPNANMNYVAWRAQGMNSLSYPVKRHVNGVIVWDNLNRTPIMPRLQFMAAELASIQRTMQATRQHLRQPVIITGPREQEQQLKNLTAQVANGEPYVVTFDGFSNVSVEALPITTGQEAASLATLQATLRDTWNMALAYLGIGVSERKMERQSAAEIAQADEPTTLQGLGALKARRQACDELNALTGWDCTVLWNSDVESNTFNTLNDAGIMLGAAGPIGGDTREVPGV